MNKYVAAGILSAVVLCHACTNREDVSAREDSAINNATDTKAGTGEELPSTITIREGAMAQGASPENDQVDGLPADRPQQDSTDQVHQKTAVPKRTGNISATAAFELKIVRHASLGLQVDSFQIFLLPLRQQIRQLGGYIASENMLETTSLIQNTISIRVPVEQFDFAMQLITMQPGRMVERTVSSQDVSTEIVDTKSRIESKRKVRDRYLELLAKAKDLGEIMTVQNEINEVQGQVEASLGRSAFLSNAAAYSTIDLRYFQVLDADPLMEKDNPGVGIRAVRGLQAGWTWFSDLVLRLLILWPLGLVGITCYFFYRRAKKNLLLKNRNLPSLPH